MGYFLRYLARILKRIFLLTTSLSFLIIHRGYPTLGDIALNVTLSYLYYITASPDTFVINSIHRLLSMMFTRYLYRVNIYLCYCQRFAVNCGHRLISVHRPSSSWLSYKLNAHKTNACLWR